MDEIRKTAAAYYANLTISEKQKASEFFKALDKDGDGKIDLLELTAALKQLGISITVDRFFKVLDNDGNGSLDFDEVITLFYLIKSGRFVYCDGCDCRKLLTGVYFTCVHCFNSAESNSFDLCCSCYHKHNFKHHDAAIFCDNYALLRNKRMQQTLLSTSTSNVNQRARAQQTTRNSINQTAQTISSVATAADHAVSIFSFLSNFL